MRFHRGRDGWGRDSYRIPEYAVVGSSDTGTAPDSPAPSDAVREELAAFRAVLTEHGIKSRTCYTQSGNCCMIKRWVTVERANFITAARLAVGYLEGGIGHYIHDADLGPILAADLTGVQQ
jgi:hypothetical protein